MNASCHIYEWVMWHIWMCDMWHIWHTDHVTSQQRPLRGSTRFMNDSYHISSSHVTHINESCHIYEWVMWHICMCDMWHTWHTDHVTSQQRPLRGSTRFMNDSYHISSSHVTHMNESCHTYEWVMSHIWMIHVTNMNESCHKYEWVVLHTDGVCTQQQLSRSCRTYEWVMSHIWMSHVTHVSESCFTYEWVMSHKWMGHVTHMDESCHTHITSVHRSSNTWLTADWVYEWVVTRVDACYEWVISHIWMSHVTRMN